MTDKQKQREARERVIRLLYPEPQPQQVRGLEAFKIAFLRSKVVDGKNTAQDEVKE